MRRHAYWILAIVSGLLWGGLAYVLAGGMMGANIWGGIAASPLIGLAMAALYRSARPWPWFGRGVVALATLFLAAALFGLACGAYDAFIRDPGPGRVTSDVVLQGMYATLWYLAVGVFIFLWPLAFLNHELLCWFAPARNRATPGCPACGYALAGISSRRCPECGEPIETD